MTRTHTVVMKTIAQMVYKKGVIDNATSSIAQTGEPHEDEGQQTSYH